MPIFRHFISFNIVFCNTLSYNNANLEVIAKVLIHDNEKQYYNESQPDRSQTISLVKRHMIISNEIELQNTTIHGDNNAQLLK